MSSIPPNIAMALLQAQFAAKEAAKPADAERNKRARDSKQLAQLVDQQQHEVEDASETTDLIHVNHDDGERQKEHSQQNDGDTFERQLEDAFEHQQTSSHDHAEPEERPDAEPALDVDDDSDDSSSHIDLSA